MPDIKPVFDKVLALADTVNDYLPGAQVSQRAIDLARRVEDLIGSIGDEIPLEQQSAAQEARAKLGPYADALVLNQIVRSPRARALGWAPTLHSVSGNVARLQEEFRTAREAA